MSQRKEQLPLRACNICGEMFQPSRTTHNFCSQKCRKKHFKIQNKGYYAKQLERKRIERGLKQEMRNKKTNHDKIADIAIEARKHGMTYGQYVAKMGL
jgi:hypothetical protein